nr:MAG: DUF3859 domain-containing protein [Hyphomicrobiales bacterium]
MRAVYLVNLRMAGLFALLALFGASAAAAQDATRVEVYEYGLYALGPSHGEYAPANMGYRHETVSEIKHLETTRIVPGRIGVSFGVRYRIQGNGFGFPVPLRVVLKFPPQGLYSHEFRDTLYVDETETVEMLGSDSYSGITFDEQWEIEPGIWTFEFWSGDRKLGEEQFEVITPPVS